MPTPSAPPNTDNTVRSMPTSGRAISTDRMMRTTRTMLESMMRRLKSSRVPAMMRFCANCASHMAKMRMMPTQTTPVLTVHRLSLAEPTENTSDFIHLMMMSSMPDTHSTNAAHSTADRLRSKRSLHGLSGRAACSTAITMRMATIQFAANSKSRSHTER